MKIGFVFAGQGAQFQGMGIDFINEYPYLKEECEKANDILGYDLYELCLENKDNKLNDTLYTQSAVFTVNYLISKLLKSNGIIPSTVCGLSLGEYNALECASVINFDDALNILKVRANLMKNAFDQGETKMAAVLKADHKLVNEVLSNPQLNNMVAICNYNTFEQVVIGGKTKELELAISLLNEAGFKKVIPLDVSCVSHMHLLEETSKELEEHLTKFNYNKPEIKFINNVDGDYQKSNFVETLAKQIAYPTKLVYSIEKMLDENIDTFIDIGPKKTTASFIKSIAKTKGNDVKIFSIYDVETFKNTLEMLGDIDE